MFLKYFYSGSPGPSPGQHDQFVPKLHPHPNLVIFSNLHSSQARVRRKQRRLPHSPMTALMTVLRGRGKTRITMRLMSHMGIGFAAWTMGCARAG